MATAHPTVSIQHYSSTGVRVKFLSIQHYYFFLEGEKFQLVDYKKIASIQLFFIYTPGATARRYHAPDSLYPKPRRD